MKIKSKVWQWLAIASGMAGTMFGLGIEGDLETLGEFNPHMAWTAFILLACALIFMRLGFAAEEREKRRYGRIYRNHARNANWREIE